MSFTKPSKACRLPDTSIGLTHQETPVQIFGRVCNQSELFFLSEPALLAGYPYSLLLLVKYHQVKFFLLTIRYICNECQQMIQI
jgi:hypothetical protein